MREHVAGHRVAESGLQVLLTGRTVKPRWRVLVIDDHAASRAAVAEAVTAQGGQVVGNGSRVEDAMRLAGVHRPDVTVLAVGLSDGDGVEAARRVMATSPGALVLLTSRTEPDVAPRAAAVFMHRLGKMFCNVRIGVKTVTY